MTNTANDPVVTALPPTTSKLLENKELIGLAKELEAANENELTATAKRGIRAWRRYKKVHDEVYGRACMNWSSHRRDLRAACRFVKEEYFRKADIVARGEDGLLHYDLEGLQRLEDLGEKILTTTAQEMKQPEAA